MHGSCFCGDIQFEIKGDVPDLYQCHCSECRKTTGSTANAGFIVPEEQLVWLSSTDNVSTFVKDSGYRVDFCSKCGSPVPNPTSIKDASMIWVPAGLLDDDSTQRVKNHIFVASKADWDEISGEANQYTSIPDDIDVLLE